MEPETNPIPAGLSGFSQKPPVNEASSFPDAGMTGTEPASPEEQEIYDAFVSAAQVMIYDKATRAAVADILSNEDPVAGIATLVGQTAARAATQIAEARKQPVPSEIIISGMEEILAAANEVSVKLGNPELNEQQAGKAMMAAMDEARVGMQGTGALDMEDIKSDFAAAQGMDEQALMARVGG